MSFVPTENIVFTALDPYNYAMQIRIKNKKVILVTEFIPSKVCLTDFAAFFYQANTIDTYSKALY